MGYIKLMERECNETTEDELRAAMKDFREILSSGKSVAFVVRKGGISYDGKTKYKNVSTTGKASRELFEIREQNGQGHRYDLLTVGSMGHSSSIALGIAVNKPDRKVWCIDGDGAVLMHMGAMAVIAQAGPENLIHIAINNGAHESVGGMPTEAFSVCLFKIAEGVSIRRFIVCRRRGR